MDWAGVDAVILDARTERHAAQVRAVPAGIPVFVEKPLGVDAAAAAEVAAALQGRPHSVGFFQHLLPATRRWIEELRGAVEDGRAPERITVDFGHDGRVSGMFTGEHAWMVDPARAEGPAGAPRWEVRGGTLTRDGAHVLTGGGPDAAIAATAFLDAVTGVEGPLTPTDAPEALAVQELVEALQALA